MQFYKRNVGRLVIATLAGMFASTSISSLAEEVSDIDSSSNTKTLLGSVDRAVEQVMNPDKMELVSIQTKSGWSFSLAGVGNILFNADDAPDAVKGTNDAIEIRRSFLDLRAERKNPSGSVVGGKVRLWLEPIFYNNTPFNRPGFGKDDTRLPLELFNEVEAFINSVPLDTSKVHMVSLTAGKGYVAFGFDRPEEQTTFEEFPLIHPLTKAGGIGQEPHVRLSYTNKKLGLTIDGELFDSITHDANLMDIDLPDNDRLSWAMRVRKTLPLQFEVLGSYANTYNADLSTSDRYAVGVKKTQVLAADKKLVFTVETAGTAQHLLNGTDRKTSAWHAELALLMKRDTIRIRYGRINNPLRATLVEELGFNYTRKLLVSKDGRKTLDAVGGYNRTSGAIDPGQPGVTRTNNRATGGIRFTFK